MKIEPTSGRSLIGPILRSQVLRSRLDLDSLRYLPVKAFLENFLNFYNHMLCSMI